MIGTLIEFLPKPARPYAVGALALIILVGGAYAVSTFAASEQIRPVNDRLDQHIADQLRREQYDRDLKEAIWINLQNLSAASGATLEPPPLPKQ
jgi:hypothetical protein